MKNKIFLFFSKKTKKTLFREFSSLNNFTTGQFMNYAMKLKNVGHKKFHKNFDFSEFFFFEFSEKNSKNGFSRIFEFE